MTDKQRLDAYVQAAMAGFYANPLIATETHNSNHLMKFVWEVAKDMMDYVDAQEVEAEPQADAEGWIKNTGELPVESSTLVDVVFRNGGKESDIRARYLRWEIDNKDYDSEFDIIKWRKVQ